MGLDLTLFNGRNTIIGIAEIEEDLHSALFRDTRYWSSYAYLRKIKDYYTTDVMFDRGGIYGLIKDINCMRMFVNEKYHSRLDVLINIMKNDEVKSVRILGD